MKKFKKLLSVLLAMVMMLSCFSILGSAYEVYKDPSGDYIYDSNDKPASYLYSDEQRFSWLVDTVDGLLRGLNINITETILGFITIKLDLRSLALLFDSFDGVKTYTDSLGFILGELNNLDFGALQHDGYDMTPNGAAQQAFEYLLQFLSTNAVAIGDIVEDGTIDLGLIGNFVNLSAVDDLLADLPGSIGSLIYGFGSRKLTNGIGDDPAYPNSTLWDDLGSKPTLDSMVKNILVNLLTNPRNTTSITDKSQNTITIDPESYGIDDSYIHEEVLEDGETKNYYLYATWEAETTDDAGNVIEAHWVYTKETTDDDGDEFPEEDKIYISHWDEGSKMLKGKAAEDFIAALDLTDGDLYTLLENMLGWAYDSFGGHNLDGQLRATLMQFCGAFNEGVTDKTIQGYLQTAVNNYKAMEEDADFDKSKLQTVFKDTLGVAGNYNFMYIALNEDGTVDTTADINDKPDNLYYVVEWGGSWEYYHVVFDEYVSTFFDLIDWEYQAPTWAELTAAVGWTAGTSTSLLQYINNLVGTVITTAVNRTAKDVEVTTWNAAGTETVTAKEDLSLTWNYGTADGALAGNITNLVKLVIKADTRKLFGSTYHVPYGFDSFTLEEVAVELGTLLVPKLIPALVLPETVTTVEEIIVYGVRELIAEVMPHTGSAWDAAIATAAASADKDTTFFNLALDMGVSIGAYYLCNLIGLGTVDYDGATIDNWVLTGLVPADANNITDASWKSKLNIIIDWVIARYLSRLDTNIAAKFSAMSGTDPIAKLSAIFSALAPTLLKVIGANDATYAINLQTILNDIAKALNGDFSNLGKGLMRKASGTSANMSAISAIGTFLVELFGGLGFDGTAVNVPNWSNLKGLFDNAMATDTPLQTLIGAYGNNVPLGDLLGYFLSCLADTRSIWLYDVMILVTSFVGGFTQTIKNTGITAEGLQPAYTGGENHTVSYSVTLGTSGVRTYFNNGRYGKGSGAQDNGFKLMLVSAVIKNAAGEKVFSGSVNTTAQYNANTKVPVTVSITDAPSLPETWTVETTYKVVNPDGSISKDYVHIQNFICSELLNDSLVLQNAQMTDAYDTSGKNSGAFGRNEVSYQANLSLTVDYNWKYVYISELEDLTKAEEALFTMTQTSYETGTNDAAPAYHDNVYIWVNGYGVNNVNADGSISISDHSTTAFQVYENGTALTADQNQDLWFKWNVSGSKLQNNGLSVTPAKNTTLTATDSDKMWIVETDRGRGEFTADATTYKIVLTPSFTYTYAQYGTGGNWVGGYNFTHGTGETSGSSSIKVGSVTSYITLYNSYNLASILETALGKGYSDKNIDTSTEEGAAAWELFKDARDYASLQLYGYWNAESFRTDHQVAVSALKYGIPTDAEGVAYEGYSDASATISTFKYAADLLDAATKALADYEKEVEEEVGSDSTEEEEVVKLAPSHPDSPLYEIYTQLKEADEEGLKSHEYVLYRWFRYSDPREAVRNALNAATPPSETAPNTLVGVWSDNETIADVVNTVKSEDANIGAIVEGLVEGPTQEAIDAAAKAYADFVMPETTDDALQAYLDDMTMNSSRLLAKYDSNQYYFLNDAVTKYGNEVAADYTEKSYEVYAEALTAANTALTDAKSNKSTQYDIFSTRYNLLVAYKALIPAGEEVDMTALKNSMAAAQEIFDAIGTEDERVLANGVDMTLEEAYEQLLLAMGYEVAHTNEYGDEVMYYIGGNYNGAYALAQEGKILALKQQGWVDGITSNLDTAIANFKAVASEPNTLMLKEDAPSMPFIDIANATEEFNGFIYGIDTLGWNEDATPEGTIADYLTTAYGDEYLDIIVGESSVETTGTVINVLDEDGNVVETYMFIYFGDVDMDGMATAGDGDMVAVYELLEEGIDTVYQKMASDIDGDGMLTAGDGDYIAVYELLETGMPTQQEIAEAVSANAYA